MAKGGPEKQGVMPGGNIDIDLSGDTSGKEFLKLAPKEIEGMIDANLLYLDKVRYLRNKLQKDDINLWDELESCAKKPPRAASLKERRKLLRRLEDFTFILTELDPFLEKQKHGEEFPDTN